MSKEILLSPKELLYVASLLGAAEFVGISDAYQGMDESEILQEFLKIHESLEKKGYAEADFDGNFTIIDEVIEIVRVCTYCGIHIVTDKNGVEEGLSRALYYLRENNIVKIKEKIEDYTLRYIDGLTELANDITRGINCDLSILSTEKEFSLNKEYLEKIRENAAKQEVSEILADLINSGCSEIIAESVVKSLIGQANFFSVVVNNFEGEEESLDSFMYIETDRGMFELVPVIENDSEAVLLRPQTATSAAHAISKCILGLRQPPGGEEDFN